MQKMNDITSDFACLKVSALGKASRISGEIDRITIGPDSAVNNHDCDKSENIENEQNSCNIKDRPNSAGSPNSKIYTQNGITFSANKILLESELQRKEEVRKRIEHHWQHMKRNEKAIREHMAVSHSYMAKERERRSAEKLACILAEEEKRAEQEEIRRQHEQQLHAQNAQEQKEKLEILVEEYRKRMKEKEELHKKVISLRNEFGAIYCEKFAVLLKSCKDQKSFAMFLSSYSTRLKELCQQAELIDEKIKNDELVPADVNVLENMVSQITEIFNILQSIEKVDTVFGADTAPNAQTANEIQEPVEVSKQNVIESAPGTPETEIPKQLDVDIRPKVPEDKVQQVQSGTDADTIKAADTPSSPEDTTISDVKLEESKLANENKKGNLYDYVDQRSLQTYVNSQQTLNNYEKTYSTFLQSASTKKFRFDCQKAINIPVNTIAATSEQHLRDKYDKLRNLLMGKSSPNVAQYPQGTAFCKFILAKKIVNQGETLVSSKPNMAFPIAAIIIAIWTDHPDFGDLLLAHFHNACPFIVPIFLPKIKGQSDEDYYKSIGYKYMEDGTVEKHDKYLKRMSGLMRLYASITITGQRKGVRKSHPHGLQHAWRWLAAVLNTEPKADTTDLCATLVLDMLEVAGNALWLAYPKQFLKLLILLSEEYYPRMQSAGCIGGGPLMRLEEFLKRCLTKGSISPPAGQLSPNFW